MPKSASKTAAAAPKRLLVIDGANTVYRAFFAIPHLRAPDGSPTNAVHGFATMLQKVIREEAPDAVAVVFDAPGKTFRHQAYPEYKAGRDAQPEDLSKQFPVVRELVDTLCLARIEVPGVEADDVIATLVAQTPETTSVVIVSTDKDLMQLASERVTLLDSTKNRRYGPAEVEERFGVPPAQMLDLRALVGDSSDNIPGVKGIGEKGAAKLIGEWRDLENLLAHAAQVKAKRAREALQEQADEARLSKQLATLRSDVELPLELAALAIGEPDLAALRRLYERLGFTRLLEALEDDAGAPASAAAEIAVDVVRDAKELGRRLDALPADAPACLVPVFGEGNPAVAAWIGLAFAEGPERAAYVPLCDPAGEPTCAPEAVAEVLTATFGRDDAWSWGGKATKALQSLVAERGGSLPAPGYDVEVAAFLLDPAAAHDVAAVASRELGRRVASQQDVAGRGAKAVPLETLPVADVAAWSGAEACVAAALRAPLAEALERDGLEPLYLDVELPLTAVLSRMERAGVRVDEERLVELSREYEDELRQIEREIYDSAGEEFLVSSPKQLQRILFEKLKLPVLKKTKTGYSTDEGVLEQLAAHHPLPERILAFRRLSKLKSTYIDALPPLVNASSGRIHPTFLQTGAATGRLAANHPNVQNIPIRTEQGIRIREAFVPAEGRALLSADYSQVELRILAHYSEDASLIDAFEKGEDIHRRTAAEVAGVTPEDVDDELRARAKAVNFGIIYGSSAFGLANQLGIATGEAQETIKAYFARYEGVRRFLDETVATASERGFVTTLLGRRRYLPDLRSRNRVLRQAAERMAVNTVIQGTAADLIKSAMVAVDAALQAEGHQARVILQVHDELVFELPAAEIQAVTDLARREMASVMALRVPLVVDVGHGANWREAH
ncbi:MAG: DNA polymerase I [Proteobacteria bacterium]|nr:DNA polymerase I [Pseudomonadota bacterium]